jgi:outer membrane protein OmpA-like peptidoglycan-associated protein
MRMKAVAVIALAIGSVLLAGIPGSDAADMTLNAVLYPDGQKTDIKFQATERAPKATLAGNIQMQQGQAQLEIKWSKLEPALLFGGDANCWVLWTVTPDGTAQSLGELPVRAGGSSTARFSTPFKQFALMVTAEPLPIVRRPSDLVAFLSMPSALKTAKNAPFAFGGFRTGMAREKESIAGLQYKEKTPVELQQARKAVALMDRYEAEKYAQEPARNARVSMGQAEDAYAGRVGKSSDVLNLSLTTVALASEAVRLAIKQVEESKSKQVEAQRLAELSQMQAETEAEKAARLKIEADLATVQQQKAQVEAEREQIRRERDALAQRLSGALGTVAATERTGRGLVVSMAGNILFGRGRADLTPDAKISLAKLSGILMMIQTANIQVEGHTDSTGTDATNQKLSLERATAVKTFLKTQGVDEARITATGIGSARPVAPNATPEGRAKNRRVEIVIPQ